MDIVRIDFLSMNSEYKRQGNTSPKDHEEEETKEGVFLHKKANYDILKCVFSFLQHYSMRMGKTRRSLHPFDTMAFHSKVKNFIQNSLFFLLGILLTTGVFQIGF